MKVYTLQDRLTDIVKQFLSRHEYPEPPPKPRRNIGTVIVPISEHFWSIPSDMVFAAEQKYNYHIEPVVNASTFHFLLPVQSETSAEFDFLDKYGFSWDYDNEGNITDIHIWLADRYSAYFSPDVDKIEFVYKGDWWHDTVIMPGTGEDA